MGVGMMNRNRISGILAVVVWYTAVLLTPLCQKYLIAGLLATAVAVAALLRKPTRRACGQTLLPFVFTVILLMIGFDFVQSLVEIDAEYSFQAMISTVFYAVSAGAGVLVACLLSLRDAAG